MLNILRFLLLASLATQPTETCPSVPIPGVEASDGVWAQYQKDVSAASSLPALEFDSTERAAYWQLTASSADAEYGAFCGGTAASPPAARLAFAQLLRAGHLTAFRYILRFGNPAGRAYAAEAFYLLEHDGIEIPQVDRSIARQLRRSQNELRRCSGCTSWTDTYRQALSRKQLKRMQSVRNQIDAFLPEAANKPVNLPAGPSRPWQPGTR